MEMGVIEGGGILDSQYDFFVPDPGMGCMMMGLEDIFMGHLLILEESVSSFSICPCT